MDFGSKLEDLNMTTDELTRLSKAMKDEKFRELLHEYAQEISDPENRIKYEQELAQLEQERGNEVKFLHPIAHHVLKTSVNQKEKCFINICSNNLIDKPTCEAGRNENGQYGQCWSLPYSLTPGRPDRDGKGNMHVIYDVIFHPDTLNIADKNQRFMRLVNSTAVQGVENAYNVTLDKVNTILKKVCYKGVPQPSVIRKQIPGYTKRNDESPHDSPFNIPYPETMPINNSKAHSPSVPQCKSLAHTQPNYSIKYRSFVDFQDYRCSRDSTPGSRPKEIIITIDLPLLASAAQIDLNVTDRKLTLQSEKPNYKLELHLSYPVNEDNGDAKFNKAKKQLIVTLAVQPTENYARDHVEENPPERERNDDMGMTSDERVDATRLLEEKKSEVMVLDASCDQENRFVNEEDGELESYKSNSLESKTDDLTKADATTTCKIHETGSRSFENAMDGTENPGACTEKKILESHANKEPDNNFDKGEISGVDTQMKPTASHLNDVYNGLTNLSNSVLRNSKVESSHSRDGVNQTNSPDTIKNLDGLQKKDDQNATLDPSLQYPNKQAVNVDPSKQSKTDLSFSHSPILIEKNPEDGSEVIIMDHTTSAALSFQNTLWFELD